MKSLTRNCHGSSRLNAFSKLAVCRLIKGWPWHSGHGTVPASTCGRFGRNLHRQEGDILIPKQVDHNVCGTDSCVCVDGITCGLEWKATRVISSRLPL